MSGDSGAVTTCYPSQYPPLDTTSSNLSSRTDPAYSESPYVSNQRSPIMMAGSCSLQQRISTQPGGFEGPAAGLSPHGQRYDSPRYSDFNRYPSTNMSTSHNTTSGHSGHLPNKGNCSVFSIPNERYALDASSSRDHENEDEFLIHHNNHSLCMCVFDGHDGLRGVKFVKKYMTLRVFETKSWISLSKLDRREEMEGALAEFIKVTDADFFRNIKHFIDEKLYLQSQIPKV